MRTLLEILVDGFVISALYSLGAAGFTIIFGVSGVLNLAHGGIMVIAAMVAWLVAGRLGLGPYWGALGGVGAALVTAYVTYFAVVRPIARSRRIPEVEKEIFVLTATLLWGIMIQEALAYVFTSNPVAVPRLVDGITRVLGVSTPTNELVIGVAAWLVIGLLWLFVTRTRLGKAVLAASINPRGLALLGFDLERIQWFVWGVYGLLAGIAGVLVGTFLGASSGEIGGLTASAFSIVVLGGLGSVPGSLVAAYIIGFVETVTAYLVSPSLRNLPALIILVLILYVRPQGLFGRR
ncbi:MAG TPA: branched-chain amino acid ABC transporter permease [Burkholderiales bacterium]|nr:branched-chain amino acid ABC transporter permease [Burkholderiales bacterium]